MHCAIYVLHFQIQLNSQLTGSDHGLRVLREITPPKSYRKQAILVAIFCCPVIGMAAVIKSYSVSRAVKAG